MKKLNLVLVGNGMAGVRTIEELIKLVPDLYDITIFGAEPHPNYNRILLSPVLAGEQTLDEIVLNSWDWYKDNHITLHAGKKVVEIDRVRRVVRADDGTEAPYDRLLLCTGSNPFMLPIPGKELNGVIAYRDIADTQTMIETAKTHQRAVVIGGGLLGLEAANGLMRRGMEVTVVHVSPWLMERQLDDVAGRLLQKSLEARGLKFLMGAQTEALVGDLDGGAGGRVRAIRFKPAPGSDPGDGSELATDLVVMAVGIRPNTELAEKAGLLVSLFDRQLVELKAYAPNAEIRDTYVRLDSAWSDYKAALVGSLPGKPGAPAVLQADARVLALAHQGTQQYEALSGRPLGKLVNVAGRQRMLSQRMAKFYFAATLPVDAAAASAEIAKSREEFVSAMALLRGAPEANARIRDELALADGQWVFFDQALHRMQAGPAPKALSDVFVTSENLLSVMDRITGLYAGLKT